MLTIEASPGSHIGDTIQKAIAAAKTDAVQFTFNDVIVRVRKDSDPQLVYRDWERALRGCTDKVVGPEYRRELSAAEKQHDAAVRAAAEARTQTRVSERDRQNAARRTKVDALIEGQAIQLTDADGWEKTRLANQDGYGGAAFRYCERFGRVIQAEVANGMTVAEAATKWEFEVDDDGMTGFQQGCALSLLQQCWKYGPELRAWNKTKYAE